VEPAKADRAKELRREMTPAERLLWERLRRSQVAGFHFRRQQVIGGFIADYYCHSAGLVVEVDGSVHDQREAEDADRDRVFGGYGIAVLRVRNEEVLERMEEVLKRIAEACRVAPERT
jgi:very-short-patch-repair endonuclease